MRKTVSSGSVQDFFQKWTNFRIVKLQAYRGVGGVQNRSPYFEK